MKKTMFKALAISGIVLGITVPANIAFAKKASLKSQQLSSVTFNNKQLKGTGTKGAKITVYHGKSKIGSAKIKKSHFTFKWAKLNNVKNGWKLKVSAHKSGYKNKNVTITANVKSARKVTVSKKPVLKAEYLSGKTFVTKEGTMTFSHAIRESDGMDGTNFLLFLTYTNTTSKMQDLSSIVYYDCTPLQNLGSTTKELEISSVDEDSSYYNMAQAIDSSEYVNPGKTVSTVAAWTAENSSAVNVKLQTTEQVKSFGTLTFN